MSTHRSYFSKNNTIISDSLSNTGRNPITDLYFGSAVDTIAPNGYTRFIYNTSDNMMNCLVCMSLTSIYSVYIYIRRKVI